MTDIAAACEHATCMVHSLIATPNVEDWRGWILHASDDLGEELLARLAAEEGAATPGAGPREAIFHAALCA